MDIALIQASSQKDKNSIMERCLKEVAETEHRIINFGVFSDEEIDISYVDVSVNICFLLSSGAVDFAVTGCSSGQGMMMACNSLPGLICGYTPTPADAYLFAQINEGNAVSYPLGLNWGWGGEINFKETMRALFAEPFGGGYPKEDATRKLCDMERVRVYNALTKRSICDIWNCLEDVFIKPEVREYILEYGTDERVKTLLKE